MLHSGAKDNFALDPVTGVVTVAEEANLDIQRSGDAYEVVVSWGGGGTKYL